MASSNLLLAVGVSDTTLSLGDTTNFSVDGGVVLIGTELISFTTATDRTLIGCVRGVQGTTPATHVLGAIVTQTEVFPYAPSMGTWNLTRMQMPVLSLTDPVAVPTSLQIEANPVIHVLLDNSGVNQTWTLPTMQQSMGLMLMVTFAAASTKTLTINSVSITVGAGQLFVWDGTAWFAC